MKHLNQTKYKKRDILFIFRFLPMEEWCQLKLEDRESHTFERFHIDESKEGDHDGGA